MTSQINISRADLLAIASLMEGVLMQARSGEVKPADVQEAKSLIESFIPLPTFAEMDKVDQDRAFGRYCSIRHREGSYVLAAEADDGLIAVDTVKRRVLFSLDMDMVTPRDDGARAWGENGGPMNPTPPAVTLPEQTLEVKGRVGEEVTDTVTLQNFRSGSVFTGHKPGGEVIALKRTKNRFEITGQEGVWSPDEVLEIFSGKMTVLREGKS